MIAYPEEGLITNSKTMVLCNREIDMPEQSIEQNKTSPMSLGELMSKLYKDYMEVYHDPDMAAVATAASINKLLAQEKPEQNFVYSS